MSGTGEVVTFAELDAASNRLAHAIRRRGLGPGSIAAVFVGNEPQFHEVAWAAQRCGLVWTPVNTALTAREVAHILDDSGAELCIASDRLASVAESLGDEHVPQLRHRIMIGDTAPGWESYESVVAGEVAVPIDDECEGATLLYSSGTTGTPKGIYRSPSLVDMGTGTYPIADLLARVGLRDGDVYLCPAPLYHAAPLGWSMTAQRLGATVVVMERFRPEAAFESIERYGVAVAQFVPTMLVRMLRTLQKDEPPDVSSLKGIVHAGGPCPPQIKHELIEWLGPIVYEYYGASEGMGTTFITSDEWLTHPGSVGRALRGRVRILDDDDHELPAGRTGTIWFEGHSDFEYLHDPAKTAAARRVPGCATVGDLGFVDDAGYLYLTDRAAHLIIRGGVNIYPREVEDVLAAHREVLDVAVVGTPDDELGERVIAFVVPVRWNVDHQQLEAELLTRCRTSLARFKVPDRVEFRRQLPRYETGKLDKRRLVDERGMAAAVHVDDRT
jgi:fatty-acyl-CoA synthase